MAATRPGAPRTLITFDQAAFGASLRILKNVDKALYTNLRKTIRIEANKIKNAQAAAVKGTTSPSGGSGRRRLSGGAGGEARASYITGGVARSAADARRAGRARSLRSSAAGALKIEVRERPSARSRFIGVKIRMSSKALPFDQRRLPKHMNYGRWRHPVFGNMDGAWAVQVTTPVGWFDGTFAKMRAQAAIAIGKAIDDAFATTK